MRILHVIAGLDRRDGGPPEACLQLCRELARRGQKVSIYSTDLNLKGAPTEECDAAVTIKRFACKPRLRYSPSMPLAVALRRDIPSFDIVHINSLYTFPSTAAAYYCRQFRVPYLLRPHGTLDPYIFAHHRPRKFVYEKLIELKNLKNAAAVHFTAAEEMELARRAVPAMKGVVVPLGVHPREYDWNATAKTSRASQYGEEGRRSILFLGRLNYKKGLDLLVKAFGLVARTHDDVRLILAGPDEHGYSTRIRCWLKEEGLLSKARFAGMLTGKEKVALLHRADVFVLPSYSENFGLAVVEAMASGLPVVISNRVNIWREVADANAGIVVNCDAAALADGLMGLLDDSELRRTMGVNGRRLVRQRYDWKIAADQMLRVYREILSKSSRWFPRENSASAIS
jgi:glycosyltransferase involved in cell wall biosynthesis